MVAGNPAEPHAVNAEGSSAAASREEQVRNVREAYRILYRSDLMLGEAVSKLRDLGKTQPEVARARGVHRQRPTRSLVR